MKKKSISSKVAIVFVVPLFLRTDHAKKLDTTGCIKFNGVPLPLYNEISPPPDVTMNDPFFSEVRSKVNFEIMEYEGQSIPYLVNRFRVEHHNIYFNRKTFSEVVLQILEVIRRLESEESEFMHKLYRGLDYSQFRKAWSKFVAENLGSEEYKALHEAEKLRVDSLKTS